MKTNQLLALCVFLLVLSLPVVAVVGGVVVAGSSFVNECGGVFS